MTVWSPRHLTTTEVDEGWLETVAPLCDVPEILRAALNQEPPGEDRPYQVRTVVGDWMPQKVSTLEEAIQAVTELMDTSAEAIIRYHRPDGVTTLCKIVRRGELCTVYWMPDDGVRLCELHVNGKRLVWVLDNRGLSHTLEQLVREHSVDDKCHFLFGPRGGPLIEYRARSADFQLRQVVVEAVRDTASHAAL